MVSIALLAGACSNGLDAGAADWQPSDAPPALLELNERIEDLANERSTAGSPIIAVSQFDGFDAVDDTIDGIHPSVSGEDKLASTWVESLAPILAAHPNDEPSVLLLGDSITHNHYRAVLWRSLQEQGHRFDLIGTQNSFPVRVAVDDLSYDGVSFDTDHEGHIGWTANEILVGSEWDPAGGGGLEEWLGGYTPDIVALHIGTNDLVIGELTPAEIATDIGEVVDRLRLSNPDVAVLVAQIIPYIPIAEPAE